MSPDPTLTEAAGPGRSAGVDEERGDDDAARDAAADAPGGVPPSPPPTVRQRAADRDRGDRTTPTGGDDRGPGTGPVPLVTAEEVQSRRQRRRSQLLRARKVKRVVRRFDAWSVLKVSFIFFLCVYAVSMVSSVILWNVADRAGVIEKVESFIEDLGAFETFEFVPDELLRGVALGGAVLAVLATGLTALAAVLFNLISDLVGGIRLTVIEEPGARPAVRPRRAARLAAGTAPTPPAVSTPAPIGPPAPAPAPAPAARALPDAPPA